MSEGVSRDAGRQPAVRRKPGSDKAVIPTWVIESLADPEYPNRVAEQIVRAMIDHRHNIDGVREQFGSTVKRTYSGSIYAIKALRAATPIGLADARNWLGTSLARIATCNPACGRAP